MNEQLAKDLIETIRQAFNLTDDEHKEVLQQYNESRNNINQFIADMYIRYGIDGEIDFPEFQRLHMHEVESYLEEEVSNIARTELLLFPAILISALALTYNKSAYHIEQNLNVPLEMGINFSLLRPESIDTVINYNWSGVPFSERIWDNTEALIKSLRQELTQGLQQGESIDKMAKRINKQFNSKAYESQRLIRTEAARVITDAQEQIYKDSGVVKELQFTATLDSRTSQGCRDLDGKRYRIDDPEKPLIPRHPNCRSCWIAIPFDDYNPKVRKDNETKEIIPYQTYNDWKQSKGIS